MRKKTVSGDSNPIHSNIELSLYHLLMLDLRTDLQVFVVVRLKAITRIFERVGSNSDKDNRVIKTMF